MLKYLLVVVMFLSLCLCWAGDDLQEEKKIAVKYVNINEKIDQRKLKKQTKQLDNKIQKIQTEQQIVLNKLRCINIKLAQKKSNND